MLAVAITTQNHALVAPKEMGQVGAMVIVYGPLLKMSASAN